MRILHKSPPNLVKSAPAGTLINPSSINTEPPGIPNPAPNIPYS